MNSFTEEAALLLRARQIAELLGPEQIQLMLKLSAGCITIVGDPSETAIALRRYGCAAVMLMGGKYMLGMEQLGTLVADVLEFEGRLVPGLGKIRRKDGVLFDTDTRVLANYQAEKWICTSVVPLSRRETLMAYFADLEWQR